jgi:hypothetical protein
VSAPVDRAAVKAGSDPGRVRVEIRVAERDDVSRSNGEENTQEGILRWAILAAVVAVVAVYVGLHLGDGFRPTTEF